MEERFDLKRFARTALLATAVAACSDGIATKSSEPTISPIQTPSPTELVQPTPKQTPVLEGPLPTEKVELSMEQQAANAVFDTWLNYLNSTQAEEEGINKFYLKTSIANLNEWKPNIDIIKNGGVSTTSLLVNWVGGEIYPETVDSDKFQAIKSQGFMALEEISVYTYGSQLTNGQKSQGITWAGDVTLNFKTSYAENEFWPTETSPYAELAKVKNWVFKYEQDPYWQESPIMSVEFPSMKVVFQNGKWVLGENLFRSAVIGDPLGTLAKPMPAMADVLLCQNPNAVSSCQLIKRDINY